MLAHELSHVKNRDILIGSVAAALAMGITFVARMAMWGAMFGGGGDDRDGGNIFGVLAMVILAPIAAVLIQMALSRSREFEADRTGAELLGDGEPLARALEKIEAYAKQVPMNVDPAQATAYIINPLTGRKVELRQPVHDAPAHRGARRPPPRAEPTGPLQPPLGGRSPAATVRPARDSASVAEVRELERDAEVVLLAARRSPSAGRRASCRSPGAGRPGPGAARP